MTDSYDSVRDLSIIAQLMGLKDFSVLFYLRGRLTYHSEFFKFRSDFDEKLCQFVIEMQSKLFRL